MGISEVAESGFGRGADDYERGRPSYAADVVDWLVRSLDVREGATVVDLAAGTGKLTRLLRRPGIELLAVEPVATMRAKLADTCPGASALEGTAEAIPLPDGRADAITVAQAFHWFEPRRALAEIARVLRAGGALGILFNERDAREPWVAELSRLIRWDERLLWNVPHTVEVDWAATLAAHGPQFEPATRYDSVFVQELDADTLVARVLSTSYIAARTASEREALSVQVRALAEPLGARFELPYVSVAYAARRR